MDKLLFSATAITTALGLALGATGAHATQADWPKRAITFVVPSGAGGTTDIMARLYAQHLSVELKQPIVVENKPGASGMIALRSVLNAPADGYTFVVGYPSNMIAPRYQFNKLGFDADTDFVPVSKMVINEMVVVGSAGVAGNTFKDYLSHEKKHGKAHPNYASYGDGSYGHLIGNYINLEYALKADHVAYKSELPMLMAVSANEVPWGVATLASAKPLVDSGKIKVLGILSTERSLFAPQVPTMKEQGFEDPVLAFTGFSGLFARKGTPDAVIQKLEQVIEAAGRNPVFREKFTSAGIPLIATNSKDLAQTYLQQISYYKILSEKASLEKK